MLQQIDRTRGAGKRIAQKLVTVLIILFAAAFGLLGGDWGQASAQTIPTLPPTQAPPGRPSSTPTATFVIVPSPTATPSQTATVAEATETAVPSIPASQTSASTPTDKPDALVSSTATVTPPPEDQAGPEAEGWWQSPWVLAIGLALLLAVIGLVRVRKGVRD